MSKKIFLAGSSTDESDQNFKQIAEQIAICLFNGKYEIIINSLEEKNSIDYVVVNKIAEKLKGTQQNWIVNYYECEKYNPFTPQNLENIEFRRTIIEGSRQKVIMRSIIDSDCVILIGGKVTVELIGQLATLLEKPMLPLPWYKSPDESNSSEKLWKEYNSKYSQEVSAFIDNSYKAVKSDPKFEGNFISILKRVMKEKPFSIETIRSVRNAWKMLLLVVFCLIVWFNLFLYGANLNDSIFRSLCTYISVPFTVFLGIILRFGNLRDLRLLLLDFAKALIVSFGLVLIYIYAGYLSSGKIAEIGSADFRRITINLSILGLFSGFMIKTATSMLQEKLKSFVSENTITSKEDDSQ